MTRPAWLVGVLAAPLVLSASRFTAGITTRAAESPVASVVGRAAVAPVAESICESAKLAPPSLAAYHNLGVDVALSADGQTLIAGASAFEAGSPGAVHVFVRSESGWNEAAVLAPSAGEPEDLFGHAVAIAAAGTIAVVGAPDATVQGEREGAVFVYLRDGDEWVETQRLTAGDADDFDRFGRAVATTADGEVIVVGASRDDEAGRDAGALYVFRSGPTPGAWSQETKLMADELDGDEAFGQSVALSADGTTLLVGAPGSFNEPGAVYAFVRQDGAWSQRQRLVGSEPDQEDYFGGAVALTAAGDAAAVGAPHDRAVGDHPGEAFVFVQGGGLWMQEAYLQASDGARGDGFGGAVAREATRLLLGAPGAGVVYVYEHGEGLWSERFTLAAGDGTSVGFSTALVGDLAASGAPNDSEVAVFAGAVYVFDLTDPRACPGPCSADLTGDGTVDFSDLLLLLALWGPCEGECFGADLDGDGVVGVGDLLIVLSMWGPCS